MTAPNDEARMPTPTAPDRPLYLGIDIGGSFTDFILIDSEAGTVAGFKVRTDRADPVGSIHHGLARIEAEQPGSLARIGHISHGQTLALNTLLQRNGARVGLLVTEGFADVLRIGRLRLADPVNIYATPPWSPVHDEDRWEILERIDAQGRVLAPLPLDAVLAAAAQAVERGVHALAISFLHAWRNPAHEQAALQAIHAAFPQLYLRASHQVWPQAGEYERTLATALDAYIGGQVSAYLTDLQQRNQAVGLTSPLYVTRSSGGLMTAAAAGQSPAATIMSGPASGVVAAATLARDKGWGRVLTLDMGGTSADIAIVDGDVSVSGNSVVGGLPIVLPSVDVWSVGAGGGTIAWTDQDGLLRLGPRSAGSTPGPACYGAGGQEPTLTDAYVLLGMVRSGRIASGEVTISPAAAHDAFAALAARLGLTVAQVAEAVVDLATAEMSAAILPLLARHGHDPADLTLLSYGGAGSVHGPLLARELGIARVIAPRTAGTLCALGAIQSDLKVELIRSFGTPLHPGLEPELRAAAGELAAAGKAQLRAAGATEVTVSYEAELLGRGQAAVLAVRFDPAGAAPSTQLRQRYDERHQHVFGVPAGASELVVRDIRATVTGRLSPRLPRAATPPAATADPVGRFVDWSALRAGTLLPGPLTVTGATASAYAPAGWQVAMDEDGDLIIEREQEGVGHE